MMRVFAQCDGCQFISRAFDPRDDEDAAEKALADLDLETNLLHRTLHERRGPLTLARATVLTGPS